VVVAAFGFKEGKPSQLFYFYDEDAKACGHDEGYEDYPYLYFTNVINGLKSFDTNKMLKAVCVKKCPAKKSEVAISDDPDKVELECHTTSKSSDCKISVNDFYESKAFIKKICFPKSNDEIQYDSSSQTLVEIYDPETGETFKKVVNHDDTTWNNDHTRVYIAQDIIDGLARKDRCLADGYAHDTKQIWSYMSRVLYQMRNKMDPLYNSFLLAGMVPDPEDGTKKKPFLGQLDLFGTAFETKFAATGYGLYMAIPLMRAQWHEGMTYDEARALMEQCLKVLVYRDARASDRVQIANITSDGVDIGEPFHLDTAGKWNCGEYAIHDPKY